MIQEYKAFYTFLIGCELINETVAGFLLIGAAVLICAFFNWLMPFFHTI